MTPSLRPLRHLRRSLVVALVAGIVVLILVRGLTLAGLRDNVGHSLGRHGLAPAVAAGLLGINVGRLALNSGGDPVDIQGLWVAGPTDATPGSSPVFLTWENVQVEPAWTFSWWRPEIARLVVSGAEVDAASADAAARGTANLLALVLGDPSLVRSEIVIRAGTLRVSRAEPAEQSAAAGLTSVAGTAHADAGRFVLTDLTGVLRPAPPATEAGAAAVAPTWRGEFDGRDATGAVSHIRCSITLLGAARTAPLTAIEIRVELQSPTGLHTWTLEGPVSAPSWRRTGAPG